VIDHRQPVGVDDADAVARTFSAGGAVHVTRALDEDRSARLRAAADGILREWAELSAADRLPADLAAPLARRYVPLTALPDGVAPLDTLVHPTFRELARRYLGKEPEVDPNSHVRSIVLERADAHLPFHQDQTILQRRLMNVWIPLDACGVEAPGLEVVWGSWGELLDPSPPQDAAFPVERARLDPAAVHRRFGPGSSWHPHFSAGDAMLFAGATVHRTYVGPGMTRGRMSVEIRLF
jgi:hypothetical protein